MPFLLPPRPLLVAHRGNSGPSPENTALAIEQAIAMGVDMVEVDIRLSRDAVPVLIHHSTLSQTTDGRGRVDRHSLAELKQLDAGSWKGPRFAGERLLSLAEALLLAKDRLALNLDLKTNLAIWPTLREVRRMNMVDQVVVTGCTLKCVKTIRESEPRVTALLNLDAQLKLLPPLGHRPLSRAMCLALSRTSGSAGLNLDHRYIDRQLVDRLHQQGVSVWAWVVDDEDRVLELIGYGVDSITTNWPERTLKLLDREPRPWGEGKWPQTG